MLEKLIAYLKNLSKEEQEKLKQALQVEEQTEQAQESITEEQAKESVTIEQRQEEQIKKEQEVQNVEETEKEKTEQAENDNLKEKQQEQDSTITSEEQTEQVDTTKEELLDTKIELALIKLGIREDRLEAAKRLFKTEVESVAELDKLKELVKEFPEWQKQRKEQGAGFGAILKENGNSLSEEEKKLKAMGIDPKN